ncbi:hypothetical protein [Jeotgalibaca porci]|uniref:hypothetical protein n=1 Tax=Jeotgalibaca porci TaxID=1868793 RepID=UPI00359FFA6D
MTLENFRAVNLKIDRANGSFLSDQFAKAGDYNGRRLVVQLSNAGVVGDLTGVDVNLGWQHDTLKNTGLDPFEPVDLTQGIFEIYYPKEMLTNGNVTALIQIIENDHITETKNFKIKVEKSVIDEDTIVSENSFTVLQDALLTVNRYDSRIANVENSKVDKSTFEQSTNNLTAQLQQTEQELNAQLAQKANKEKLESLAYNTTSKKFGKISLPTDFNSKGIQLSRTVDGKVVHNVDINYKNKVYDETIYFDTDTGDDETGNGSKSTPYLTLAKAFSVVESSSNKTFKIVGKGRIFRDESYNGGTLNWIPTFTNKTVYLFGDNDGDSLVVSNAQSSTRVGGYGVLNNPLAWTAHNNIWRTSRALTTNVVDLKNKDFYGIGIPLKNVNTLTECESTPNSYFIYGSIVYVNTYDSRKPDDDDLLVCAYTPLFNVKLSSSKLVLENIDFYGGNNMQHDGSCYVEGDINSTLIGINCKASGGNLTNNNTGTNYHGTTNAFTVRDIGLSMMFNCGIGYVRRDGFNYHYYGISTENIRDCLAFEYNCYGHETGYQDANTNNQYSTMHEGSNVLRVNCVGHDTGGAGIEDIGDAYSILVDCHMAHSKITTESSYSTGYRFHGVAGTGKAILINCTNNNSSWDITGSSGFPVAIQQGFIGNGKTKDVVLTLQ